MRALDLDAKRIAEFGGTARVVDMAVGKEDLSIFAPLLAMASRMRGTSPPGSTMAPVMLSWSNTSEQFCWNGVTGMIMACSFVMAALHSCAEA